MADRAREWRAHSHRPCHCLRHGLHRLRARGCHRPASPAPHFIVPFGPHSTQSDCPRAAAGSDVPGIHSSRTDDHRVGRRGLIGRTRSHAPGRRPDFPGGDHARRGRVAIGRDSGRCTRGRDAVAADCFHVWSGGGHVSLGRSPRDAAGSPSAANASPFCRTVSPTRPAGATSRRAGATSQASVSRCDSAEGASVRDGAQSGWTGRHLVGPTRHRGRQRRRRICHSRHRDRQRRRWPRPYRLHQRHPPHSLRNGWHAPRLLPRRTRPRPGAARSHRHFHDLRRCGARPPSGRGSGRAV